MNPTNKPDSKVPVVVLAKAIRNLHGCNASWVESIQVKEPFQGKTVWEGTVQVFGFIVHPTATRCYA
jgi:hypothetical protein